MKELALENRLKSFQHFIASLLIFFICTATSPLWSEPMVVGIFGGSSCPWSPQLREEVWESPSFQAMLAEAGVRRQVRPATGIESETPILVLFSSQGEEIGRLGYLIVPPEKYAQLLLEMLKIEELSHHLEKLTTAPLLTLYYKCQVLNMKTCQERILRAGLARDKGTDFLLEHYAKLCKDHPHKARKVKKEIRQRKSSDAAVEWQLALTAFQDKHDKGKEPSAVVKPLKKYLRRYADQDQDIRWRCHLILAEFYKEKSQIDKAKIHATQAMIDAPSELKQMILSLGSYD